MTPEERAAECLRDISKCGTEHVRASIIRQIRQARAEGYAKAIEDAARVAAMRRERAEHINEKDAYDIAWDVCCGEIAAAIRALPMPGVAQKE